MDMNWKQLEQASLADIVAWAEDQPWCQAMAACVQDAQWHAEGDVWTHTKMVLAQLTELAEWSSLSKNEQRLLIFTALFHDVAKPLTTQVDEKTGQVTSPKHAVKGEHVARAVLRELDCDLTNREQICRMVRYHGRPVFLFKRKEPAHEVAKLSWLVSNRLLYLFALADFRGRENDSRTRLEEDLHLWKAMAEETDCYDRPYPFVTDHARFTFFRQAEPNLYYEPYEDFSCQVTIMSGLPGSGKDQWLRSNRPDLPVVSLDDMREELGVNPARGQGKLIHVARERCKERLRAKESFAFNATNTMSQTRGRWVDLFADYHARIEMVYLEPPFRQILQQNKNRQQAVPERIIHKLAGNCHPPTWLECHQLLINETG